MEWVFWVSLGVIAYTYAGYPFWLYLRSRWRSFPVQQASISPTVSIVLAVHNEATVLHRKLRNLTELNYPADRYEIVVVSDGSTDATNQILTAHAHERLRVFVIPRHEGKASALNRGIQEARGEIVVFTDARQIVSPEAISHLVANFADPSVGCVSGELMLGEPNAAAAACGIGLYWRIEKKIRDWEGSSGSDIGATGALYAVRTDLLVPLPAGTILDDVYLPLHVVRQGARVVFEPRARAWDDISTILKTEFRRKVRTLTGNYQLLQLAPWLLTRANPVRFEFVCHKLLRLLVPFALAGVLFTPVFFQGPVYKFLIILQLFFYGLAALAICPPRFGIVTRLANISLAFVVLNAAAAVAFVYFVMGKRGLWVH